MKPSLTRQRLLLGGGLTGLLDLTAASDAARSTTNPSGPFSDNAAVLTGVLEKVSLPRTIRLRLAGGGVETIQFDPGAFFFRDYRTSLVSFQPGETVVVEGTWEGAAFSGSAMANGFVRLDATILERQGEALRTTKGVIRFTNATRIQRGERLDAISTDYFSSGQTISALVRVDPANEFIAVRVWPSSDVDSVAARGS